MTIATMIHADGKMPRSALFGKGKSCYQSILPSHDMDSAGAHAAASEKSSLRQSNLAHVILPLTKS